MTHDRHPHGGARLAAIPADAPPRDPAPRPAAAASTEVALHELGESMVVSAVGIQRELRRYSESNGAFLLDDVELDLPVKLRVDALGQVLAELVSEVSANTAVARVRLRIRPDPNPVDRIPIVADQPLETLGVLSKEQLAALESRRIFSVEDLIRAARNPACRKALAAVLPEEVVDSALARGGVLVMPVVPPRIAEALVRSGVVSVEDFLARDATQLAAAVSRVLGETVPAEHVTRWKAELGELRSRADVPVPGPIARPPPAPVPGAGPRIEERSRP